MGELTLWPIWVLLGLMALNVPVAFAMGIAALTFFVSAEGLPLEIFAQRIIAATESFPLLAVPFFILAGSIMNRAGITRRLMTLADALVGHMMGGLAQANIVLATLMGGLSASANAEAAMQAKMLGPEMMRRGYSGGFTAAVIACAAVITPIIPPGIGLVIYGFLADVSVGRLFLGGVLPGLLICSALMVATWATSRRRGFAASRDRFVGLPSLRRAVREAAWALTIPLYILIGIRYGLFTPTEAGAMTVVYALLVGFFAHRELRVADLPEILTESVLATATVMLIICAAGSFGFYMAWERIPPRLARVLAAATADPLVLLLLVNALLLLVGMLLEGTAALILLAPILVPVAKGLGIDPVHFGLVLVVNLTIGGVTPPVGTMMYTACGILGVKLSRFTIEGAPLILAMIGVLALITLWPPLVTGLPNALMGPG
jgi:tripartite ATP-independent transporter DctM subunit